MNILVDTHILLWSLFDPTRLSKKARETLKNPSFSWHISPISFIEIALKFSKGKLKLHNITPDELPDLAVKAGFSLLDLNHKDISGFWKLPQNNTDPFDRLLVWQCIQKNFIFLSKDSNLEAYRDHGLNFIH